MKQNTKSSAAAKKTVARKNVVEAQGQLDAKNRNFNPEEYSVKVANKAYELFERRGFQHGYDLEDWYQAERLIKEGFDS